MCGVDDSIIWKTGVGGFSGDVVFTNVGGRIFVFCPFLLILLLLLFTNKLICNTISVPIRDIIGVLLKRKARQLT